MRVQMVSFGMTFLRLNSIRNNKFKSTQLQGGHQRHSWRFDSSMDIDSNCNEKVLPFGPHLIEHSEIFATTRLSYAFVNLKPVVPGHVLVSPKRVVQRFKDLSPEEVVDLWLLAQRVGSTIEPHFLATSLTYAIQDGPMAGQTVPHVHIHVLPRKANDFERNDDVYDAIDASSPTMRENMSCSEGKNFDLDKERKVRTKEEMSQEATVLRGIFSSVQKC
ncbi:hypothetical protein CEUSTIGMA_g3588.t1 [Chlamydomonas eustigma]|uniref:HIT domain-containing protein n=1 Tax=Chlamydomonas eustigma TaxID=1157962 RepID=A0A250WZ71_9CHLO|nr:hypothetical protein CEUSTIGMA_g3588.t1 [Chlamydomonas eustigma]|eukprot:GAX76144.1 hypothetical protein CEUSTIGMA_g3588.t1 [Chlamydomonas eustigma]